KAFRRNHVGDDGCSADSGAFDEGDVGSELGAGEGCFVPARSASEYSDPLFALELVGHCSIVAARNTLAKTPASPPPADSRVGSRGIAQRMLRRGSTNTPPLS